MRLMVLLLLLVSYSSFAKLPEVSAGSLVRLENFHSEFVPARNIDIWLPPAYSTSNQYPIIYMHDGQMLYDAKTTWNKQEWQVDEVASRLIAEKQVEPFIVVGIWNNATNRHSEYFPQKPFDAMSKEQKRQEYARLRGSDTRLFHQAIYSDNYLKFIVEELKPFVEEHYRVKPKRSYLLGSSMGGLISWYGLLEYSDVFQGAACLSTHWPGNFSAENNPVPDHFQAYIKANIERLSDQPLYFDYGTETLDAMYPELQAEVDKIVRQSGYPDHLWHSQQFSGADHSESAWASRLEYPIRFLLTGQVTEDE